MEKKSTASAYSKLLLDAWNDMVNLFEKGYITFYAEGDLRSHLFSCCINYFRQGDYFLPWEIHAEKTIGTKRADIILGKKDVALELKFLRYTHATPTFQDVIKDASKVAAYLTENSFKHAFLGIIDEKGTSKRKMPMLSEKSESWREIETDKGLVIFVLCEITP